MVRTGRADGGRRPGPAGEPESLTNIALSLLRTYWRYEAFRPGQEPVVLASAVGRDVLALLATGTGKSACYQIPGLIRGGATLVISPLTALIEDQVAGLLGRGIPAIGLVGQVAPIMYQSVLGLGRAAKPFFLFVAPERLKSRAFLRLLSRLDVRLLVADEAHCVSEWGLSFRPAYRSIGAFRRAVLPHVPLLALTATATPRVQRDMVRSLALHRPVRISGSANRPNLVYSVFDEPEPLARLVRVLGAVPGAAVVYDSTRRGVERWAERLALAGYTVAKYHGGMRPGERERSQRSWMRANVRIMVATNAFGMGIDKPDVRVVAHVGMPESLAAYYQEAGRGGRDGRPAHAVLIRTDEAEKDRKRLAGEGRRARRAMKTVFRYARTTTCRREWLVRHFGDMRSMSCGMCDNCTGRHEPYVPLGSQRRERRTGRSGSVGRESRAGREGRTGREGNAGREGNRPWQEPVWIQERRALWEHERS